MFQQIYVVARNIVEIFYQHNKLKFDLYFILNFSLIYNNIIINYVFVPIKFTMP